jgi:Tol biopolymer transport system component
VLELWVMDRDGGNKRQVTRNGAANFCPYFTPDGKRLIFSSNLGDPRRREFDLYLINLHGTGLERVTYTANAWFGEPTVAATAPARPTSSSPTGWSSP